MKMRLKNLSENEIKNIILVIVSIETCKFFLNPINKDNNVYIISDNTDISTNKVNKYHIFIRTKYIQNKIEKTLGFKISLISLDVIFKYLEYPIMVSHNKRNNLIGIGICYNELWV